MRRVATGVGWTLGAGSAISAGISDCATRRWASRLGVNGLARASSATAARARNTTNRIGLPSAAELLLQLGQGVVDGALLGHLAQLLVGVDRGGRAPLQLVVQRRLGLDR